MPKTNEVMTDAQQEAQAQADMDMIKSRIRDAMIGFVEGVFDAMSQGSKHKSDATGMLRMKAFVFDAASQVLWERADSLWKQLDG